MPDPDFASPPSFETIGVVNYVPSGECTLPNVVLKSTNVASPGLYQCVPNDDTYTTGTWQKVGEAASGIDGTLTAGKMPIASAAHVLEDGIIDYGVTRAGGLSIKNPGTGGILIEEDGAGIGINLSAHGNVTLYTDGTGETNGILIENDGVGGTTITDTGGGGIALNDNGGGGIQIESTDKVSVTGSTGIRLDANATTIFVNGVIVPETIYSAAGTPLPAAASGLAGARAFVSDATANVYGTAYTSGGSIKAPVYCDGAAWNMG